ncbi:alanine racemase [Streptomyces sp. NPDC047070]|uniref:alanine racemase n=1 Tax=Streptomyces sp. NPDC047070 TaxID=3154923 RepID=UPI00345214C5
MGPDRTAPFRAPPDGEPTPRAEVVIDLAAVRHNITLLSSLAAESGAATMAVVKADAYGHGLLPVARAALSAGATWLGTCDLASAFELRENGISARLFSWLDLPNADYIRAITEDIDLSVSSLEELLIIAGAAHSSGLIARVHLKIDTGLWRNGCHPEQWPELTRAAATQPAVEVVAIWSHLACADETDRSATDVQAERFEDAYRVARAAGLEPARHIANSAATLTRLDLHFDLVRVGIAAYGLDPLVRKSTADLQPAMTFRSSVVLTKRIPPGESVSYGSTWTAQQETTLALVPVGYADGIPRSLSGRMAVWIDGRLKQVVGRICMDQLVVDCGDDQPRPGTEVILFGSTRGAPTARDWANMAGTIDYEIVTGMYRPRVHRRHINNLPLPPHNSSRGVLKTDTPSVAWRADLPRPPSDRSPS